MNEKKAIDQVVELLEAKRPDGSTMFCREEIEFEARRLRDGEKAHKPTPPTVPAVPVEWLEKWWDKRPLVDYKGNRAPGSEDLDAWSKIFHVLIANAEYKRDFITDLCRRAYETSKAHGWKHDNDGQAIALMHSELSEALEAMRKPHQKDEHLPHLDPVGLELADVLIRVFDFCGARGIDLATCLKAKMDYNDSRPMKHGGKLF